MLNDTDRDATPREAGSQTPNDVVYEKGGCNKCLYIDPEWQNMTVLAGSDLFHCDVSFWTVLACASFTESSHIPDFRAFVSAGP
jgi:hypothetical protein